MHINTFWKIIIKSIGLSLLISCIDVIPQYMATLNFINGSLEMLTVDPTYALLSGGVIL